MKKTNLEKVAESLADDARSYAARYKCTLLEAIQDRDYPISRDEAAAALKLLQIPATAKNIKACRPNTDAQIANFISEEYRE